MSRCDCRGSQVCYTPEKENAEQVFAGVLEVSDYPRGKLRLVKPSLEHAALSLKWLGDREVGQYMGADFSDVSMETEERRIRDILAGGDTYGWMIELDGDVIGAIEVNRIKESSEEYGVKTGNFSTLIGDKQHWGKRVAPYAARAVMEWGFAEAGFELFIGKALTINERSWRSLEGLGFEFRGLKSDMVNGRLAEWRVYTMTKQHWQRPVPFSNGYYYPPEPRAQVLELLKLKQSGEVLDIGAGFGNNILPLLGYDFKITATETNPDCIAGLKQLALAHPGRIKVVGQPLESLVVDLQYDVVICTMVLHFLEPDDGRAAMNRLKEWTKPGGINIVTSYTANNPESQLREHGVRFLLEAGGLKLGYEDWEILSYEEARGTSKNALGTAFESARLMARKPRPIRT